MREADVQNTGFEKELTAANGQKQTLAMQKETRIDTGSRAAVRSRKPT
jgi:hypothetical protein